MRRTSSHDRRRLIYQDLRRLARRQGAWLVLERVALLEYFFRMGVTYREALHWLDQFQNAVSYSGTHQEATPVSSGTTISTPSITVSGANPVLLIGFQYSASADRSVNVTFGGTGTVALAIHVDGPGTGDTIPRGYIYCVKAPSGSGVVSATSPSDPYNAAQLTVALFNGAHQTDPCPTGDAQSSTSNATSITVTPTNLTAEDASFGCDGHTVAGDCNGVTPNQIYLDSTTAINAQTGYRNGTGGIGFALTAGGSNRSALAARIQVAPSGNQTPSPGVGAAGITGQAGRASIVASNQIIIGPA